MLWIGGCAFHNSHTRVYTHFFGLIVGTIVRGGRGRLCDIVCASCPRYMLYTRICCLLSRYRGTEFFALRYPARWRYDTIVRRKGSFMDMFVRTGPSRHDMLLSSILYTFLYTPVLYYMYIHNKNNVHHPEVQRNGVVLFHFETSSACSNSPCSRKATQLPHHRHTE